MNREYPELYDAFLKYDDIGEYVAEDLLAEVKELIADGDAPESLFSVVNAYQEEINENYSVYAGRGDVESAEDRFIDAVREQINNLTTTAT